MPTITIPKELAKKDDLVVISRQEYEEFLRTRKHRKFYEELDKDLDEAIKDYRMGKCYGPFDSIKEAKKFLESRSKRKLKK